LWKVGAADRQKESIQVFYVRKPSGFSGIRTKTDLTRVDNKE